jgi:hypothetical protein
MDMLEFLMRVERLLGAAEDVRFAREQLLEKIRSGDAILPQQPDPTRKLVRRA